MVGSLKLTLDHLILESEPIELEFGGDLDRAVPTSIFLDGLDTPGLEIEIEFGKKIDYF
jgi:hypothetical protein